MMQRIRILAAACFLLGLALLVSVWNDNPGQSTATVNPIALSPIAMQTGNPEERTDGYYSIVNEAGRRITATALPVYVGDDFIDGGNNHYRISRVNGDTATAKFLGIDQLAYETAWDEDAASAAASMDKGTKSTSKGKIAVYHTHSDESYVPTDGSDSIYGNGGIIKVGTAYSRAMEQRGVDVVHSRRSHDPHDVNAYSRSRRTAMELLKQNPVALVDVHRDATPANVYLKRVQGKEVTKIKLVVGRSNPRSAENLKFAQNIKSYLDKNKPGLIEGIYMGRGVYNQDLSPRAILIEVGSHTNSRIEAQNGVALFADAIPKVTGIASGAGAAPYSPIPSTGPLAAENRTSWATLGWILLLVILGVGLYLLLATGSIDGSVTKLKQFIGEEFANALVKWQGRKNK